MHRMRSCQCMRFGSADDLDHPSVEEGGPEDEDSDADANEIEDESANFAAELRNKSELIGLTPLRGLRMEHCRDVQERIKADLADDNKHGA